ncbi:MAG: STAS domain-containing protein [Myxococcales bacterium]|nr:STAS domain-containing protein [Myxococcales bacterium]
MNDELLRERNIELEHALATERMCRQEAEAMLGALHCIADAEDRRAADGALGAGLGLLLQCRHTVMLRAEVEGGGADEEPAALRASATSHPLLTRLRWSAGSLRRRVLAGKIVAIYDVCKTPELAAVCMQANEDLVASNAADSFEELRSALLVPLSTRDAPAILLAAHEQPAFFGNRHVTLARSFARTAVRVLESLDARELARERARTEERVAALQRSNQALREQLETIGQQRREIQRLRAPVLQVGERTLVVPVIGELDGDALLEITESLLQAITRHRARTIILDLTGFESTSDEAAGRIESLARTTAMLGARCHLCGIRPGTAVALSRNRGSAVEVRAFANLAQALTSTKRELPSGG